VDLLGVGAGGRGQDVITPTRAQRGKGGWTMRLSYRLAGLALLLMAVAVEPAAAQQLDTPTISIVKDTRSSITLAVVAGPSGAPAGFVVEWMKKSDFDANGGIWPAESDSRIGYCLFDGTPTFHVSTGSYLLGSLGIVQVELGDIFDETGVYANSYEELGEDLGYVVRVYAKATGTNAESGRSSTQVASTAPDPQNCTFTIGYWKTHPDAWPVSSLTVGCETYTKAELLSILNQPAGGNGALILGHQLIGALLNIANGADPSPVSATIASGNAKLCALGDKLPPVGAASMPAAAASPEAQTLDDYNNGVIGPGHCGEVRTNAATWGNLKAKYH
jgi:hypothetical protein